ncbi:beta strand repeat-containing protein [Solimonas marina]|uniref:Big-1 domain-containing protein n=1 Tax=Solimonas marina TaxID=2714601 RepID=A0A969WDH0_9GAMM|nr:Ig-like domain-containing protein [Solimonas marina]NKF23988.1 hypothetical protein [Solimonas marina]
MRKLIGAVSLLSVLMLSACGGASLGDDQTGGSLGGSTTGGSTTGSTTGGSTDTGPVAALDLVAAQSQIIADGTSSTVLTATVTDTDGNVVSGSTVTFATNAGTLSTDPSSNPFAASANAQTDTNGQATVYLRSTSSVGTATVVARESETGISGAASVAFVAGAATQVSLSVAPTTVVPGGTSSINVQVTDANGNPVTGTSVTLSASTNQSGGLFASSLVSTDDNGRAATTYQAGAALGTDVLKASLAGGQSGSASLTVSNSSAQIGAINLTLGASSAVADGATQTSVSAKVTDTSGNPMQNVVVTFSTSVNQLQSGTTKAATVTAATNASGIATALQISPTRVGTAAITAATGGYSAAASLTFVAGTPSSVLLSVSPTALVPGGAASVRAVVLDANSNRVPGVAVTFSSTTSAQSNGGSFASTTVTSDSNGEASTQYTAPSSGYSSDSLKATTAGGQASPAVTVGISADNASVTSIVVTAGASQLSAGESTTLRATVQTSSGAISGVPVSFSVPGAVLTPSTGSATTNSSGQASVTMTAPTTLGTLTVTASAGGFSAQTTVKVSAGAPNSFVVSVASSPVVPGGSATISAQVLDVNSNPVAAGQQVNFRIVSANSSGSSVTPAAATTDANGNVSASFVAGTSAGSESIELTSGSATQQATVVIDADAASVGGITISPANPSTTAMASQTIVATVVDSAGHAVVGKTVNFSATAGDFDNTAPVTDASGKVSVTYTAPASSGSVTLSASSGGYSATASLTVAAGTATAIKLTAAPSTVAPSRTTSITATVRDASGNGVPNHAVQFSTTAGSLSASSATTDSSGTATVVLTAPSAAGDVKVSANVAPEGLSDKVKITVSGSAEVVGGITLTALSSSIPADGASTAIVRAVVTGSDGTPLPDVTVDFSTSAGAAVNGPSVPTDQNGQADFELRAASTLGSATVTAKIAGFSKTANVQFVAGDPYSLNFVQSAPSVKGGGAVSLVAVVQDKTKNPVSDITVNFSFKSNNSGGSLTATSVVTGADGRAVVGYTAGNPATTVVDQIKAKIATNSLSNVASVTVTNPVKVVTLVASSSQLASNASTESQGVTLTALVKDQNNNVLPDVSVDFAAKLDASSCGSGGALQVTSGTTDATGRATAVLTTGGDTTNQLIDVTATASSVSDMVQIQEAGTTISIAGPASVGLNAKQSYTVSFKDAGNNPISSQVLTVSSSSGNTIAAHSGSNCSGGNCTTDSNGQFTVDYTGSSGGSDTLTVTPQACSNAATVAKQAIQVASQTLTIVAPTDDAEIPFSGNLSLGAESADGGSHYVAGDVLTVSGGTFTTPAQLTVSTVDAVTGAVTGFIVNNAGDYTALPTSPATVSGGSGTGATFTVWQNITVRLAGGTVSGQNVSFNTTRGTLSATAATTDADGVAQIQLNQASAAGNAGGAVVTATCTSCSPTISASTSVQFNATTAASVVLQASPSTVAVNGTSVITTTVRDANNNPVANQSVNFTLNDDSGGALQESTAVTNSGGQATITYKGGATTGSQDGVTITGTTVAGGVSGSTTLTVGGQALRIVLGTGNTISALNSTQYQMPYSVLVTDSAGNPPPAGSVVNLTINALAYQKGSEGWNGTQWTVAAGSGYLTCSAGAIGCADTGFGCANEDINFNGLLDAGEDFNTNTVLDPGNPASVPATVTLDANGTGQFDITYPKDRAHWVQVQLTATIVVNGDQGSTSVNFELQGLSSDFTTETVNPPGQVSPYGEAASCANPN